MLDRQTEHLQAAGRVPLGGFRRVEPGEIDETSIAADTELPGCAIATGESTPRPTEGTMEPFVERRQSDRHSRWFSIATEHQPNGTTLRICGDLDAVTARTLTVRVDEVLHIGVDIRLDLSNVAFLGSAGLAALVQAREAAAAVSTSLQLVVPNDHRIVRRALTVTGLSTLFEIVTPEEVAEFGESDAADCRPPSQPRPRRPT